MAKFFMMIEMTRMDLAARCFVTTAAKQILFMSPCVQKLVCL